MIQIFPPFGLEEVQKKISHQTENWQILLPNSFCSEGFHKKEVGRQKPNQGHSSIWIGTLPSPVHSNAL